MKMYRELSPEILHNIEQAVALYFTEQGVSMYCRGLYDDDEIALDEFDNDVQDIIEGFI